MQGRTPRSICRADYHTKKLRLKPDAGRDAEVNLQSRLLGLLEKVKELTLISDAGRDAEVNMQSRLSGKRNKNDTRPSDTEQARS